MYKRIIYLILMLTCFIYASAGSAPEISAKGAVLIDGESREIIFGKNAYSRMKPASTTKILTGIIALEKIKSDECITVSKNAAYTEGSSMYLKEGERIFAEDIVYGLMLNSGNDAAVAIAEHISGTEENFAKLMNEKAAEIGAENTNFVNPNGLDDDMHYTTPYDLALITAYAMKNQKFSEITSTVNRVVENASGDIKYLHNHNKLLSMYKGCNGVKTGFTKASGRTLVSSAERDGMKLVAVTMNAPDDWNDHIKILDYGFENFETVCFLRENTDCIDVAVEGGIKNFVGLYPEQTVVKTVSKGKEGEYALEFEAEKTPAPVCAGDIGGYAVLKKNGTEVERIPLLFSENVEKNPPGFEELFRIMLSGIFY